MIAIPKPKQVDQLLLGMILSHVGEVSPISHNGVEIEQKYLFLEGTDKECQENFEVNESDVRSFFEGRKIDGVAPFDGIDYYFNVRKGEMMYPFRYRSGSPVHHRLGVKVKKTADGVVRDEIEFQVREDMEDEKILDFLRTIALLGDSCQERWVRGRGNIRNEQVMGFGRMKRQVEVVVYVCTNIMTGRAVSIAEIEAHGFDNEAEAIQRIGEYEKELDWGSFRTTRSVSQLL